MQKCYEQLTRACTDFEGRVITSREFLNAVKNDLPHLQEMARRHLGSIPMDMLGFNGSGEGLGKRRREDESAGGSALPKKKVSHSL